MYDFAKIKEYTNEELTQFAKSIQNDFAKWGSKVPGYTVKQAFYYLVCDEINQRKNLVYRAWKISEELQNLPKHDPFCPLPEGGYCDCRDYTSCVNCEFVYEHACKMKRW